MMKFSALVFFCAVTSIQGKHIHGERWGENREAMMKSKSILKCEGGHFVGMEELLSNMEPITSKCLEEGADTNFATTRCILLQLQIVDSDGFPSLKTLRNFISTVYSPQVLHDVPEIKEQFYGCAKNYASAFIDAIKNSQSHQRELENFIRCFEKTAQKSIPTTKQACEILEDYEQTKKEFINVRTQFFGKPSQ